MFKQTSRESLNDPAREIEIDPDLIRHELRRILASRHFQTSRRGKEFLEYVVNQKISGGAEVLKERLIGVQIFGRKPDYSTGEDPVVRVQAGDVRRRLERYHADPEISPEVLIEIPLGSYAPVFRRRKTPPQEEAQAGQTIMQPAADGAAGRHGALQGAGESSVTQQEGLNEAPASTAQRHMPGQSIEAGTPNEDVPYAGTQRYADHTTSTKTERWISRALRWMWVPLVASLVLTGYLLSFYIHEQPDTATTAFWRPAVGAKPVLLCLPRPMVYKPADKLFDRYTQEHPEGMATREARQDKVLPLSPTDTIQWGDMIPVRTSGPGIGGVIAALNMSRLLTEQGLRFETRFGSEATYAEMRDSPVLVIGGINTDWATQLMGESSFAFDQTRGAPNIHETGGAKRVWKTEASEGRVTRDYGLITRELSGKAGPCFVQVAGISHFGTGAASELLVQPQGLAKVLNAYSINLQKKNVQILIATDVTDDRAGPPHIVAVSSW